MEGSKELYSDWWKYKCLLTLSFGNYSVFFPWTTWAWTKLSTSFPCDSAVINLPANAGDVGSVPGLERSPGEGNGNPFLGNPMDRAAWQAIVHGSQRVMSDSAKD